MRKAIPKMIPKTISVAAGLALVASAAMSQEIPVGHLNDFSGATSDVGLPYGQGVDDALKWVNSQGGIKGRKLAVDSVEYGYQVPRAVSQYKKWLGEKVVAIQGWGTADTEALVAFVTKDEIPYVSGSYSAALTDPQGKSGKAKPAPYNFFYGPSYSDALRAELTWAAEDWKAKGKPGKPKFVHMGGNHPFPNAPKEAGEAMAKELGFEVLPSIVYALAPGDYTAQCLTAKNGGANYAYLGNTAGSNISVLKACKAVGTDIQFMGNVWGMDENAAKAAGEAADGIIIPIRTGAIMGENVPGMATMEAISKVGDPSGNTFRPAHYLAGICAALYMTEAMDWASANGGVTGPNIRNGFYQKKDWVPAGTQGVCLPSTWTASDHRGSMTVNLYRARVKGPTDAALPELIKNGTIKLEKVKTVDLPRRPDWLGW